MNKLIKPLSDAALLPAPQSAYMSEAQLRAFKERLVAEEKALRSAAAATTRHLQKSEAVPDPTDRASTEEEHTLELRVRDRERKLLNKIAQALKRIADGSYGWCIGIARLLARPTASLSLEAQQRHEQRKRQLALRNKHVSSGY